MVESLERLHNGKKMCLKKRVRKKGEILLEYALAVTHKSDENGKKKYAEKRHDFFTSTTASGSGGIALLRRSLYVCWSCTYC